MVVKAEKRRHRHLRRCRAHQASTTREYVLRKFVGLNERTCLNQKPIVKIGQKVKKGQIIADGAATHHGELALGRNVLVAFMSWDGYNFEDAIIISERLVKNDTYTSIHIEEFEIEIRETKLGKEEFTRDIPTSRPRRWPTSTTTASSASARSSSPGDILVGKVSPKSQERADAGREAAARDLRPGRRGREERQPRSAVGRRRHRHRHAAVQPPGQHDRGGDARRSTRSRRRSRTRYNKKIADQFRDADRGAGRRARQEGAEGSRSRQGAGVGQGRQGRSPSRRRRSSSTTSTSAARSRQKQAKKIFDRAPASGSSSSSTRRSASSTR